MCGRFTQNYTWAEVYAFLNVFGTARNLRPHYNIAPTTNVDVIRLDGEGRRELVSMRWGLVPYFWKKSLKEVPATFNARAETIAEKPMFRDSFKRRRCIIPASGFFEWRIRRDGKQPQSVHGRRRLAYPRFRRALGSLDRPGDEGRNPVLHGDRLGRIRMDDVLSRSHAGVAAGRGFRRLAQRLARRGRSAAGR
jgi:hypothetical protein